MDKRVVSIREVVGGGYDDFWRSKKRYIACKGSRGSKKSGRHLPPGSSFYSSTAEGDGGHHDGDPGGGEEHDQAGRLHREIEVQGVDQRQVLYTKFLQHGSFPVKRRDGGVRILLDARPFRMYRLEDTCKNQKPGGAT